METSQPLTPTGVLALNAMLGIMKLKGALTDEMISHEEGQIIFKKPWVEWPPKLQQKLAPYGAGPVIR
jgi:hypothetical protein